MQLLVIQFTIKMFHTGFVQVVMSLISVDFDAEVFWHHLIGFTYFAKPNGCGHFLYLQPGVFVVVDFCLLGLVYFNTCTVPLWLFCT